MEELLLKLKADYPHLTFVEGTLPCWSPEKKEISYDRTLKENAISGILHELGHAHYQHTSYETDVDLLSKEVKAWEEAQRIAKQYSLHIDEAHIQDCLDTYREWLYKRSTCPHCTYNGLQTGLRQYQCPNCGHVWRVTSARFYRPYRLSKTNK